MTVKNRGTVPRSHGEGFLEHKDIALGNDDDLQSRTNALEYDNDGTGTDDDSMKENCDEHTLKPSFWRSSSTKHGEQKNEGTMKYDTKGSSTSSLSPGKSSFETRYFGSYASMSAHPDQDRTLQTDILIRGEDGAKGPTSKTAHQLDLEAAIILVEMANGVPALPDDDFSFSHSKDMEDCDDEDVLHETYELLDGHGLNTTLANKGQHHVEACAGSVRDGFGTLSFECNRVTKRKWKAGVKYMDGHLRSRELIDEEPSLKIQEGLHKVDAKRDSVTAQSCYSPFSVKGSHG